MPGSLSKEADGEERKEKEGEEASDGDQSDGREDGEVGDTTAGEDDPLAGALDGLKVSKSGFTKNQDRSQRRRKRRRKLAEEALAGGTAMDTGAAASSGSVPHRTFPSKRSRPVANATPDGATQRKKRQFGPSPVTGATGPTVEDKSLQVAVVDGAPFRQLSSARITAIREAIKLVIDRQAAIPRRDGETGFSPHFNQSGDSAVALRVLCADEGSKDWLVDVISRAGAIWPGAQLRVISQEELSSMKKVRVFFPGPASTEAAVKKRLSAQNQGMQCEAWAVLDRQVSKDGSFYMFGLGEGEYAALAAADFSVYFELSRFRLTPVGLPTDAGAGPSSG